MGWRIPMRREGVNTVANQPDWRNAPMKMTWQCFLIYLAPVLCFVWFGAAWKILAAVPMAIGIWYSDGFLRPFFGGILCIAMLMGSPSSYAVDWRPAHDWLFVFWVWSAGTRCHADGMAEARNDVSREPWR
jgi:hypothetical protein